MLRRLGRVETVPFVDPRTGEIALEAQIFVAVLGASNFTYAEAFASQELAHWISGHVHAFEAWGGCPRICVPDNPRTGVTSAHRYEPILNATYAEMAAHYGVAVIPARPYKPRDKAKAEAGVQVVQRWILARLRRRTFFSLAELNAAIAELLRWLNARPFKKLEGSRQSLFDELDRPALRPLPQARYQFGVWKTATVNIDYHVEAERHYYSVPYQLAREAVDVRISATTVEIFHRGRRVARGTCAAPSAAGTPRRASTCPRRTAATSSGRRAASCNGPRGPGQRPPRSSRR